MKNFTDNHFWYSEKQLAMMIKTRKENNETYRRCHALIDGKYIQYTEATKKKKPCGKWNDYQYLGYGKIQ